MAAVDDGGKIDVAVIPGLEDWVSLSRLAEMRGVSRQAVSKRIKRLKGEGHQITRGAGRSLEVSVAAYDQACGDTGDAHKQRAADTARSRIAEPGGSSGKLSEAQARKVAHEADLRALELAGKRGNVVPIKGPHGIEQALVEVAGAMLRRISRLPNIAADVAAAAANGGEFAVRKALREEMRAIQTGISDAMARLIAKGEAEESQGSYDIDVRDDDA